MAPRGRSRKIFLSLIVLTRSCALGAQPSVASPHLSNGVAQLSQAPRIWLVNDFLDKAEVSYLRGLADATQFGACENQRVLNNGKACAQLKISSSTPVLDRLAKLWHVDTSHIESLAAVRYSPGSSSSAAHVDHYSDGTPADMTIVLYLTDAAPEEAGHTNFPSAGAAPLSVAPKAGSLLAWMNVDEATGKENPMAKHSVGATPDDAPHDRVILQFSITLRPQLKRSCPPLPSSWPHSKGFDPLKEVSASRAICSTHVGDDKLFPTKASPDGPMAKEEGATCSFADECDSGLVCGCKCLPGALDESMCSECLCEQAKCSGCAHRQLGEVGVGEAQVLVGESAPAACPEECLAK